MPLSTDKQLLLCHQMFAHLEKPRIDALLGGCLGAVRRAMTAASTATLVQTGTSATPKKVQRKPLTR